MKYYITVITGFREDQRVDIPLQEAHKAFYLFKHPEERGVFDCGVALIGRNIQEIKPNWNKTMGYNPEYELTTDDWNDIAGKGIKKKMQVLMETAKRVADMVEVNPQLMKQELGEIVKVLKLSEKTEYTENIKQLEDKFKL